MKTKKLLLLVMVLALGWAAMRAVTVSPYSENFAGVDFTEPDCAPDGWGHIVLGKQVYELLENVEGVGTCLYIDYQYGGTSTYNMFVTPAVTGTVTLQAMYAEAQFGQPWLKFFYCTKNDDGSFTQGSAITDVQNLDAINQEGFTTLTIDNVPAGSYIGIAASYAVIANFTATSADVEKVDRRQLKVSAMTYNGPDTLDMNPGNTYVIPVTIKLRNTGNVDLETGDEDFSVSLITTGGEVVDTKTIDQRLARATETAEMNLEFNVDGNEIYGRHSFYIQENVTETHYSDYFTVMTYKYEPEVEMYVQQNNRYVTLASGSTLDFGQTKDIVTREFFIDNTGGAPFEIGEVTVPEGFVTLTKAGDIVAAHSTGIVVIAMDNSVAGKHEGEFVLKGEGIEDFHLTLSGTVIDSARWFVDFEDGIPANMIAGSIWQWQSYDQSKAAVAQTWEGTQYQGAARYLISPKLEIKAGEALNFKMAKSSYYVPDLNVYFSTDRKNWTLIKDYVSNDFDRTTIGYSGQCRYTDMTIDTFEPGVGYIMFEGYGVALDDISGFTVVPVEHDWMITSEMLPIEGEVNTEATAQIKLQNYGPEEAADSYTAELLVDGRVVATAQAVTMAAGAVTTFDFAFTPHDAGTFPIVARVSKGDYVVESTQGTITIKDEVVSNQVAVGNADATNTITGGAPVDPSAMYQVSEIIYPASKINLPRGAKITRIAFKGRNTGNPGVAKVQAWIENTTDAAVSNNAIHATDDMTPIMDKDYTFLPGGAAGMTPTHAEMLVIELAEPFVYDGTNLRLRFHSVRTTSCTVRYQYDDEAGVAIQQTNWKDEFSYFQNCEVPVMYLDIEREATTVSGTVTAAATGNAVAGAQVVVSSGDVQYTATTANDGTYTVQVKKDYLTDWQITVAAAGYTTFQEAIDLTEGSLVKDVQLQADSRLGDVTGDGKVDVADVNAVINIILKTKTVEDYPGVADIDGDGKVDVSDVNAIINKILKID
ncbi:MAG: carboxypeptidase regulatory-like domain-containing protein [Muribaculaceae bacterium]|nr:carboxypeptidase regulatory-like domain-containing protein [Muribaculaceae bacterium]